MGEVFKSIDWNHLEDSVDLATWDKANKQFWLPERVPISKDLSDWNNKLNEKERVLYDKVLAGLTMLDTLQSEQGGIQVGFASRTQHEKAVMNQITFMESVHSRSYSSIFSTLRTTKRISEIFKWTEENEYIQYKAKVIEDIYQNGTDAQKRVASVFLESFLFYSGFFTPLYYVGMGKMSNVAEVIKLILKDEALHGQFIGYKHRLMLDEMSDEEREEHEDWAYELLDTLYKNEVKYTQELYDELGYTEDVKQFLKYNADRALMNLGLDTIFEVSREDVNPLVMNGLSTETSNHDFFSQVGNGYEMGIVEAMKEEDYDIVKEMLNKKK